LQDRLVKELRLAGAATLAEDNALLPTFVADYSACFAKGRRLRAPLKRTPVDSKWRRLASLTRGDMPLTAVHRDSVIGFTALT